MDFHECLAGFWFLCCSFFWIWPLTCRCWALTCFLLFSKVLTSKHCANELDPDDVFVYAGKHDLDAEDEKTEQSQSVIEWIPYPNLEWEPIRTEKEEFPLKNVTWIIKEIPRHFMSQIHGSLVSIDMKFIDYSMSFFQVLFVLHAQNDMDFG